MPTLKRNLELTLAEARDWSLYEVANWFTQSRVDTEALDLVGNPAHMSRYWDSKALDAHVRPAANAHLRLVFLPLRFLAREQSVQSGMAWLGTPTPHLNGGIPKAVLRATRLDDDFLEDLLGEFVCAKDVRGVIQNLNVFTAAVYECIDHAEPGSIGYSNDVSVFHWYGEMMGAA